jgi:hypothetical protein
VSRLLPILLCVSLATLHVACGTSAPRGSTARSLRPPPVSDGASTTPRELARAVLLQPANLPGARSRRVPRSSQPCSADVILRRTALATAASPRFQFTGVGLQQTVGLFASRAVARKAFRRLTAPSNKRCAQRELLDTIRTGAGAAQTGHLMTMDPGAPPLGARHDAQRLIVPIAVAGGFRSVVSIDVVAHQVGRAVSVLAFVTRGEPVPDDVESRIVRLAVSRIESGLRAVRDG